MATKKKALISRSAQAEIDFNNIIIELDNLAKRRQIWEDGLQRAADVELYEILQVCFLLYGRILLKSTLRARLSKALVRRNVKQTAGSSLQLKVIRYVFGECSQEFTYARAIKEAHLRKPDEISFIGWLTSEGGPSGVKRRKYQNRRRHNLFSAWPSFTLKARPQSPR